MRLINVVWLPEEEVAAVNGVGADKSTNGFFGFEGRRGPSGDMLGIKGYFWDDAVAPPDVAAVFFLRSKVAISGSLVW
jgi:hypothetical protein